MAIEKYVKSFSKTLKNGVLPKGLLLWYLSSFQGMTRAKKGPPRDPRMGTNQGTVRATHHVST